MMAQEMKIAIASVWLIVSAILLAVIIAPYFIHESALLTASGFCQLSHQHQETCLLCGMTRAFIAISQGHFAEAFTLNQWSLPLYGVILTNELSVIIFLANRTGRFSLGHREKAADTIH